MKVMIDGVLYVPAPAQPMGSSMTDRERSILAQQIDKSGIQYSMVEYSEWRDGITQINDPRFHQLRDAYVESYNELRKYLDAQGVLP